MAGTRHLARLTILLTALSFNCNAHAQSFDAPGEVARQSENTASPAPWNESAGVLPPVPVPSAAGNAPVGYSMATSRGRGGTTFGGSMPGNYGSGGNLVGKPKSFDPDDYLQGVGAGRMVGETTNMNAKLDYHSPWNKGTFEGHIDPRDDLHDIQKYLRVGPLPTHEDPGWAHFKLKMRSYQDGQEHHGNDDPYGFFNQ